MTKTESTIFPGQDRKSASAPVRFRLLVGLIGLVVAQVASAQTTQNQPFFPPSPPLGFNPVTALDGELELYGFPPRPPLGSTAYDTWAQRMANVKTRLVNPVVQSTKAGHTGGQAATSNNWSGAVASGPTNYFNQNGSLVDIGFQVPASVSPRHDPYCQYGPYVTSIWGGMDGFGNGDVLQAGVNVAACYGPPAPFYFWYEWWDSRCGVNGPYPCNQQYVQNLTVRPGDYVWIRVAYYSSGNYGFKGYAFLSNQTTGQSEPIYFNPPFLDTNYQGATAEWVVERPTWGSPTPVDLMNFSAFLGPFGNAIWLGADYGTASNGAWGIGYGPESTVTPLTMTCTNSLNQIQWLPNSNCSPSNPNVAVGLYYPPSSGGYYGIFAYPTGPTLQE